jgi:hypothetical protein
MMHVYLFAAHPFFLSRSIAFSLSLSLSFVDLLLEEERLFGVGSLGALL